ncbi:MAG: (d)CMP kinase [Chitinivibrionales bacterium]|nr:(d)CMP kinase [Chitinivibrionales bacterium]MBD3396897.1 (d)CMP kinase [Chitinivibrionales bacterium]
MIIAIDGPAGSGKSTTAKLAAQRLGVVHLDTGAMYRAITLKSLREGIRADDTLSLEKLVARTKIAFSGSPPGMRVWMDGEDITDAVRSDEVTKHVSDYCAPRVVRRAMVGQQRALARATDVVCEGRDIGTVVFPDADLKFFIVASVEERARRRQKDFEKMGVRKGLEELCDEIAERDRKDSTRRNSPLRKADDAEEIDTTEMTIEEQVGHIVDRARARGYAPRP